MADWRPAHVDNPCDPTCQDPCALDCCCEFINFKACVHWRSDCAETPRFDYEPPVPCKDWFQVNLSWDAPPKCVTARAAKHGGSGYTYEIHVTDICDGSGMPDRIIGPPVVAVPACDDGAGSIYFTRDELTGADPHACGLCLPTRYCLIVRGQDGEVIGSCKVCVEGCDDNCSSSSSSSSSESSASSGSSGSSSSRSSGSSSGSGTPPGSSSSSSGTGGSSSSSSSSFSSSSEGSPPPSDSSSSSCSPIPPANATATVLSGVFPDALVEVTADTVQCCANCTVQIYQRHADDSRTLVGTGGCPLDSFLDLTYEDMGGGVFQISLDVEFYCDGVLVGSANLVLTQV